MFAFPNLSHHFFSFLVFFQYFLVWHSEKEIVHIFILVLDNIGCQPYYLVLCNTLKSDLTFCNFNLLISETNLLFIS